MNLKQTLIERCSSALLSAAALACLLAPSAQAVTIPDSPLQTATSADPNIMMILDDSGSMHFEILPDDLVFFNRAGPTYVFPRADGVYLDSDYRNRVATVDAGVAYTAITRSPQANALYYNPSVTYRPWSRADGSTFPNSNPTCALHNPQRTTLAFDPELCRNLTVDNSNYNATDWRTCTEMGVCNGTFNNRNYWPATYYWYNGGGLWAYDHYTRVQIVPGNNYTEHGRASRTDCNNGTCTYDQEIQNFANWYTYYRSRILTARAGIGRAFAAQGNKMRVGFGAINKGKSRIDGVDDTSTIIRAVRAFTGNDRDTFFTSLYNHPVPAQGTPLLKALDDAGQYFSRSDGRGPWSATPGVAGGTELTCRQSYTILMTDGYWTTGDQAATEGARANVDGTAGPKNETTVTSSSSCGTSTNKLSYSYTPVSPYSDARSGTLADVAMYYWKRDLRDGLENRVPTNSRDPAFWQHMVTFGVGLGVNGSINPTTAFNALATGAEINWPDPTLTDPAKLDDLLHASINGHGGFFSAQNPEQFATALGAVLDDIASRSGSASSIAVSSTQQTASTAIFNAKFDSATWTGELEALPISNVCSTNWKASEHIPAAASRTIYTKSGGLLKPFDWASLSATDRTALGSEDVLNYIRGSQSKERQFGGTFRNRTKLLGDIVDSSPAYVADTNTVYVGANDGMLHAFNGSSGLELFSYIPSALIPKLPELSLANYDHKFYVDGEIAVSDRAQTPGKNYLVAALGRGGKGLFGLDVTTPSTFSTTGAMWEYFDATDKDLGSMLGRPVIAKMNNGTMAAIVGNGYNSTDGKAVLYIFNLATGALIRKIDTLIAGDNGLAAPGIFDADTDGKVDSVYAGDLKGNVWKFDVSNADPALWDVAFHQGAAPAPLFVAKDALNNPQPITAQITVALNNLIGDTHYGKKFVFFGTGSFFRSGDLTDTSIQTWYGLIDNDVQITARTNLKERTFVYEGTVSDQQGNQKEVRATSAAATGDMEGKLGWYLDLKKTDNTAVGERIVTQSKVYKFAEPVLLASSIIPVVDPCVAGGKGFINALSPYTGGRLGDYFFDANVDGSFSNDMINGMGFSSIGISGGMPSEIFATGGKLNVGKSSGDIEQPEVYTGGKKTGRLSWREIVTE